MKNEEVKEIEIDLTNICNLRCRLCARSNLEKSNFPMKPNFRNIDDWKKQFDGYTSLSIVYLAGIFSEPTLYPDLIGLLDYFKNRNIIVELYTNGNTHDIMWWKELGNHLTSCDKVVFTVCGSTQELHEKYRVGSDLQQILDNARAFKNPNNNDYVQHIMFKYNKHDLVNMDKITDMFSHRLMINTLPYNERFNIIEEETDICLPDNQREIYERIKKCALKKYQSHKNFKINCVSHKNKFLTLDCFGNEYPCFLYKLYKQKPFDKGNYDDILDFKYEFCFECEQYSEKLLNYYNIEQVV